jgi:sphinganine-1-phosphate aldolase
VTDLASYVSRDRAQAILSDLRAYRADDLPTHGGTTTAYVFDSGIDGLEELATAAHAVMAPVNGLDPTQFPSVAHIENDLVAFAADLLHGDAITAGTVTSGGTESCLLAVLGARQRWRAGGGTGRPRLIVAATAHAAFHKAAHLFDLELVRVDVDPRTMRADPVAMAAAIDADRDATAVVVVSAPSYAYGVVDPVAEVAAHAAAAGIPCHVDACIGGWVLPFLEGAPPFAFDVPGVTSVSVDLHKYGYAPKGVSLLLHRDAQWRSWHWFAIADWPGYPVVNPTLMSTRPAGPMAAAWAIVRALGRDGFSALGRSVHEAAGLLVAGVDRIDGLHVVGAPDTSLVAFGDDGGPDDPDIRVVVDEVNARGWHLQVQPAYGGAPPTAHVTISAAATDRIDDLLAVLDDATRAARSLGRAAPDPTLVAAAATVDVDSLTPGDIAGLLALAGVDGSGLPERMAPIHALVEAIPPKLAERLFAAVLSMTLSR